MTTTLTRAATDGPVPATRSGAVRLGLGITYAAALVTPWDGFGLATVQVGDVLLLLAAATLMLADLRAPWPGLPPWVWGFLVAILIVGTVNQFHPVSTAYLFSRTQLDGAYLVAHSAPPMGTNVLVMVPLLTRVALFPVVFALARHHDVRASRRVAGAFVTGCAVSAMLAFPDSLGLTSFGPSLVGTGLTDRRASGLTAHPNVLAMTCVLALPLALSMMRTPLGRQRVLATLGFLALLGGLYAARSRSGIGAAAIAGLAAVVWLPQYRRLLPTIALGLGALGATVFAVEPHIGTKLLSSLRLTDTASTSGSDQARTLLNHQASVDFHHSPVFGVGFEVADQAHIVYLQALAVGGLVLLTGLLAYLLGALARCARLRFENPLAIPLFASVLGGAIFNAEQNVLTPSLAYIVPGMVAALPLTGVVRRPGN